MEYLALAIFCLVNIAMAFIYAYKMLTYVTKQSDEKKKKPKLQRHRVEKLDAVAPPTREELDKLKEVLGISEGSIQFKKRGFGIYHVVYSEGKHNWNHLGTWKELKQKLDV